MSYNVYIGSANLNLSFVCSMFKDRWKVFGPEGMDWEVTKNGWGGELDDFDTFHSTYIILHKYGQHVASQRYSPADQPTMAEKLGVFDPFSDLEGLSTLARTVEISRTCLTPSLTDPDQRAIALAKLSRQTADHLHTRTSFDGAIATFYSPMLRIYRRFGYAPVVISRDTRTKIQLGYWGQRAYDTWIKSGLADVAEEKGKVTCLPTNWPNSSTES